MTYPILVQKNDLFAEQHNMLVLFNVNILNFSQFSTCQAASAQGAVVSDDTGQGDQERNAGGAASFSVLRELIS